MASFAFVSSTPFRRLSLAAIDAVVSARLGPTRIQGNAQPACFNRQVAMHLAKHVAGWSTTCIGRFYNGLDHSTVIHGIQRIQALRDSDPDVDALLSELKDQLARSYGEGDEKKIVESPNSRRNASCPNVDELAEAIAERVWARIEERLQK
jgi:hypothetical protein